MFFLLMFVVFLGLIGYGTWTSLSAKKNQYGDIQSVSFNYLKFIPWLVAGLITFSLYLGFTVVDAGNMGVVKRWGQPVRQLAPGAHFVLPWAEDVTPVATQTRIIKPNEDAASKDLQIVHTEVTMAYHVDPGYATEILVGLNNDAEGRVISPAILEAIKAVTARYDVQQLIEKRAEVRDGIEEMVKARLAPYHIIAETTSITNFSFSKEYEQAIESKVTALQRAEQATNELNRVKIEAQQQVAQANAEATAKVARAKAEAESLSLQRQVLTPELLHLRTIEMMNNKWDGKLPDTMIGGNGALPMLDVLKAAEGSKRAASEKQKE